MNSSCEHCFHPYEGAILWIACLNVVIPNGHILLKCCKCDHTEARHSDHWRGHSWVDLPRSRVY